MENKGNNGEISLKEVILSLLANWKIIAIFTAAALVIGTIYTFATAKTYYESSVSGLINIPEKVANEYGVYTFPSTNSENYTNEVTSDEVLKKTITVLNLSISVDTLRSQVFVTTNANLKEFTITAKSDSSETAIAIVTKISEVFINEINVIYREKAIDTFMTDFISKEKQNTEDLENEKMILAGMEEELSKIAPIVTLKKLTTSDPALAAEIANERGLDLSNIKDSTVMFEEIMNPIYTKMEEYILEAKNKIQKTVINMERNQILYKELQTNLDGIEKYRETGDISGLADKTFDVLQQNISIINNNSYSTLIETGKTLKLVISLLAGLALGIFVSLFKNYWKNS